MSGIVWEEPPPDGLGSGRYRVPEALDQLRARPGEWARIAVMVRGGSIASKINNGGYVAARPPGVFEAVTRAMPDGSGRAVWARYVGPAPEDRS